MDDKQLDIIADKIIKLQQDILELSNTLPIDTIDSCNHMYDDCSTILSMLGKKHLHILHVYVSLPRKDITTSEYTAIEANIAHILGISNRNVSIAVDEKG